MIRLGENKGILLISTLVVALVISVMSTAYITGSLVLNESVQKQKSSFQAFYAAEKGIEYAYVESRNNNWSWITHEVANADMDNDGQINDLVRLDAPPNVRLAGGSINTNPNNNCPGCYQITAPSGTIEVKTYTDPQRPDETIALSRNTSASVSRIIKYRITRRSFFRYFFYYPRTTRLDNITFDGKGAGGIYVNGNIGLGNNIKLSNITELSTNAGGNIYLAYSQYAPPYTVDSRIGGIDGKGPLYTSINGMYIYSLSNPYPWGNGWPPYDWRTVDAHFSSTSVSGRAHAASINGVPVPRKSWPTSWEWKKYSGSMIPAPERPVQFYDAGGAPASEAYWNNLQRIYGVNSFDPNFWSTKTYQRTPQTVSVNYLDTDKQANDWNSWLNSAGINLKDTVKEKNTGGYDTAAPDIKTSYSNLAKEDGLYIEQDESGSIKARLNGQDLNSLPCWISDGAEFFNTVRPKLDNGVPVRENVLDLDIQASLDCSAEVPNNGIVYIANRNLRLVNGAKLPKSLTIVSPYNVYIKGGFNTDSAWKPSAVITNSLVYLLSNNFNDPQNLPAYVYPRKYPYELGWINLNNFAPGNTPLQIQKMEALESEIERFFGLKNNFEISAPGQQPRDLAALLNGIRTKYTSDYQSLMPNTAANPANPITFNLAIVSPYTPSGYELERWTGSSPNMKIKGSFLQLESSWINDSDGNPIRDVPADYTARRADYDGSIIPRPNDRRQDPSADANVAILSRTPSLEYEDRFISERPSGDFFAGSQALWEETSDFNHNT